MTKEPDQTKWVGIRPTDPPENIPVTESAPLTSIEVEPAPGCGNFPVTESAPLTSIEVEPAPGCGNFPVTESAPLTDIKVEPVNAATRFNTQTQKRTPAICDPYAYEASILRAGGGVSGGSGSFDVDLGPVPAGKIWVLTTIVQYLTGTTATYMWHGVLEGVANFEINMARICTDPTVINTTAMIIIPAGNYIRAHFHGLAASGYIRCIVTGWQISLY